MVRKVTRRILMVGAALAIFLAPLSLAATAATAAPATHRSAPAGTVTAPKPRPAPTAILISGDGLAEPLRLTPKDNPDQFAAVLAEVSWLYSASGVPARPPADKLGVKYTVVVLVNNKPAWSYDLFPSAAGGPRAYRPSRQPDRHRTSAAWFYGRLTMSETLRLAGAPLPERPDVVSGGVGGGARIAVQTVDPQEDLNRLAAQLQQVLLLNAGVLVVITLGLAGMSLLIRRRV